MHVVHTYLWGIHGKILNACDRFVVPHANMFVLYTCVCKSKLLNHRSYSLAGALLAKPLQPVLAWKSICESDGEKERWTQTGLPFNLRHVT